MSGLFNLGWFRLHSGAISSWKIDCDALTPDDWEALAFMAVEILPPFSKVEGVPSGGLAFADVLESHVTPSATTLLIAEDVVTTGESMERIRKGRDAIGVAVFSRATCPNWVTPIFRLTAP